MEIKPKRYHKANDQRKGTVGQNRLTDLGINVDELLDEIEKSTDSNIVRRGQLLDLKEIVSEQLNPQQLLYIKEYFVDFREYEAAKRAGYKAPPTVQRKFKENNLFKWVYRINRMVNTIDTGISAEFVLSEFYKLASVKITDFYDEAGNLIPPHQLSDKAANAVSEIKERQIPLGNGQVGKEYVYKFHSKTFALDALGKHVGIFEKDNKQKAAAAVVHAYIPDNGRAVKAK